MDKIILLFIIYLLSGEFEPCDIINELHESYCVTTTSTIPEPIPKYCGEIGVVELNKLLSPIFEGNYDDHDTKIYWRDIYKLMSVESLREFMDWYKVPPLGDKGGNCSDYCKVFQGHFSEWSPGTSFGMIVVGWDEETQDWTRHCKNLFIDCNKNIWFVEPQGNTISDHDEEADTVIMITR